MMKTRFGDAASAVISVTVVASFKGNDQVKIITRNLAFSGGDYPRRIVVFGFADSAFVWMRGEKLN
jgi:hypothetical protein